MAAVCVFCASSKTIDERWLALARDVGVRLGQHGHRVVSGGGRVGMMGTLAEGARQGGGFTYGVIPQGLVDLEVADEQADELVVTDGMAARKTVMLDRSDVSWCCRAAWAPWTNSSRYGPRQPSACTPSQSCCSMWMASTLG